MKVCIISHCFYPSKKRGGPSVSVTNLAKVLAPKCELSVLTTAYDKGATEVYEEVQPGKNRIFGCDVYYLKENTFSSFYKMLKQLQPDVIYASSLFSWEYTVPVLFYQRYVNKNTRAIIAPRGELMPAALEMRSFKKKIFLGLGRACLGLDKCVFHATSTEEEKRIAEMFGRAEVHLATNISMFEKTADTDLEKYQGELRILTVGRIHPIKNVDLAIQLLSKLQGQIVLDVYGNSENLDYVDQCKKEAEVLPSNIEVNFCGNVEHEQLKKIYPKYHVFLSPTQTENFGHSIVEALSCGVPVVISDRTPWHNLKNHKAGIDLPLEDSHEFTEALQEFAEMDMQEWLSWKAGAVAYAKAIEDNMDLSAYTNMFKI